MFAPWEVGYNPATFDYEKAKQLEQSKANSPGDSPNPMGNEVVNVGAPYSEIAWPGGSPTNYALMLQSKMQLDKGGGESGNVSIYAYNQGEINDIFGRDHEQFKNDHERDNGVGYLYTTRDPSGRGNPTKLDDVLSLIGRSYGQEG